MAAMDSSHATSRCAEKPPVAQTDVDSFKMMFGARWRLTSMTTLRMLQHSYEGWMHLSLQRSLPAAFSGTDFNCDSAVAHQPTLSVLNTESNEPSFSLLSKSYRPIFRLQSYVFLHMSALWIHFNSTASTLKNRSFV